MTGVTDDADGVRGSEETNLAEPELPGLWVGLSMDPDDPDQELCVRYVDPGLRNRNPRDPDYWQHAVDLR